MARDSQRIAFRLPADESLPALRTRDVYEGWISGRLRTALLAVGWVLAGLALGAGLLAIFLGSVTLATGAVVASLITAGLAAALPDPDPVLRADVRSSLHLIREVSGHPLLNTQSAQVGDSRHLSVVRENA